jgi:hypothetical protein
MQQVEQWNERVETSPTVPSNSELGRDSSGLPTMPLEKLAWRSLKSAVEHLGLMVDTMRRTQAVWPSPYASLVRTALLGSAHVVWMLHPEDSRERVIRGIVLARDEYVQMHKLTTELHMDEAGGEAHSLAVVARPVAKNLQQDAENRLEDLGVSRRLGVTATAVILETARLLNTPTVEYHHGVLGVWRYSSGVVHAKAWPDDIMPPLADPEEQLLFLLASPVLMTQMAFELWDRRTRGR